MNITWIVVVNIPPVLDATIGLSIFIPGRAENAIGNNERTAATVKGESRAIVL